MITALVAQRMMGHCLNLPLLDFNSITGGALIHSISQHAADLEKNPHWWAHIYAANIHEQSSKLLTLAETGPVIVSNYYHSFRVWMRAAGLKDLSGYFGPLPLPNHTFLLTGASYTTRNVEGNFSSDFLVRVNRGMLGPRTGATTKIVLEQYSDREAWKAFNSAAQQITQVLEKKYKLPVDYGQLYTHLSRN